MKTADYLIDSRESKSSYEFTFIPRQLITLIN